MAIARASVRRGARGRLFNVVDLVNKLDADAPVAADLVGDLAPAVCLADAAYDSDAAADAPGGPA